MICQFLVTIPALLVLSATEFLGILDVWMIYPVLFLAGAGMVFDMTGRRAIVYDLVGESNIDNAMALESTATSTALALGALAGGSLIQAAGIGWALTVMAGLQIIAVVTFSMVPRIDRLQKATEGGLRAITDGVKMLRTERGLISILGVTACVNFFFFASTPLIQIVGRKFEVGPALLGLLASMLGMGMFIGSLTVAKRQPKRRGRTYVIGSFAAFLFMSGFASAPWFLLAGLMLLVAAIGMGLFGSTQAVLVMDSVSPDKRGRALGLLTTAIGVLPIGMLLLGELAEILGPSTAIVISVATGAVLMSIFLRVRPESYHILVKDVPPEKTFVDSAYSGSVFAVEPFLNS
jgi:predicted MFS family arabinose efflux permease